MESTNTTSRLTLADVARKVGVSKSAVSQAINWRPDQATTIKAETRQRILEAVEQLGYRPSWRGQMLAKRRTQAVAVVYSAPLGAVPRGVYWDIVDQIELQLGRFDYLPTFVHVKDHEERFERVLGDARFDGCISLGLMSPKVLEILRGNGVPSVLVNVDADATWARVNVDDEAGAREAMQHLFDLGHRRIVCNLGETPPAHFSVTLRAATYMRCMREAGLVPREPFRGPVERFVDWVTTGPDQPTAVLDYEHWSAVRLLQALWRRGVRVPDDISVATFNDAYPVAEVIPPLTAMALPSREIAEHAVRMLMARIDDPALPPEVVSLQERLVARESTAPPQH